MLIIVSIPFFAFPKVLTHEKEKIRLLEKAAAANATGSTSGPPPQSHATNTITKDDTGYGKDIKGMGVYCFVEKQAFSGVHLSDIPKSMWRLACNPVYIVTCLGACMELVIVSGFVVFLPKYLETQFSLGKSQASIFTGKLLCGVHELNNLIITNMLSLK